ncbi:DUF397 domain-containing protein [Streptomyces sp. ISL-11]|uniref:DUF397 domain-containing protein n=1 Tax=Streptomyces sp. ISL-11 TaxID=2819174 RepID=UPI001BEA8017|nr:DUF397 domain-containing protein [Streptomyces sp. ISL-11]MBT2384472.1 DUF397 domain-containing protein [Streptomyces sp. ISL-11]
MRTVRADLSSLSWRKSTYSDTQEDCLEIADNIPGGIVPVRDSKRPHARAVIFPSAAWSAFLAAVKGGKLAP